MQIIRKNFALKLLSVALAIIGWAYFRFATNPVIAARFDQQISVPIITTNLAPDLVAHFTDKEAVVTVAQKRGSAPVKPDEVKAVLDLGQKAAGIYNIPVQLVAPNIQVQSLTPASVSLTIEKIEDRSVDTVVHYQGTLPSNVVVGSSRITPARVMLHGATSALSQVSDVRLDVPVPNGPKTFDGMIHPIAVNTLGQEVVGLTVTPDLVRVQVTFIAGGGSK